MSCRGVVRVDLRHHEKVTFEEDHLDKMALSTLDQAPDGVRVIIDVTGRNWVTMTFAHWAHRHVDRLQIEVWGDKPELVGRFVNAVRTGDPNNRGEVAA